MTCRHSRLEEEAGSCLGKGEEAGGGALQAQEVAPPASEQFRPLLPGGKLTDNVERFVCVCERRGPVWGLTALPVPPAPGGAALQPVLLGLALSEWLQG